MANVSLQDGLTCKLPNYIATIQALHTPRNEVCRTHTLAGAQ